MNLKELTTPIRMYWDIGPAGHLGLSDYQRIAGETAANKFLSLQITETAPVLSEAVLTVLEALAGKPVALSLVLTRSAVDDQVLGLLRRFHLKTVFLSARSLPECFAVTAVRDRAAGTPDIAISFPVTRENYRDLPVVLSHCSEKGIHHLLLPMQRLVTGEKCFWLTAEEGKELTERLIRIDRPPDLKITIHDPFLWKTFYPSVDFPGGGCQAANTMLYISTEADVYPCPMMPLKLGTLMRSPLRELIRSELKQEIRKKIITAARSCIGCEELQNCMGGCRGRAYAVHASFQDADPSCS